MGLDHIRQARRDEAVISQRYEDVDEADLDYEIEHGPGLRNDDEGSHGPVSFDYYRHAVQSGKIVIFPENGASATAPIVPEAPVSTNGGAAGTAAKPARLRLRPVVLIREVRALYKGQASPSRRSFKTIGASIFGAAPSVGPDRSENPVTGRPGSAVGLYLALHSDASSCPGDPCAYKNFVGRKL